MSDPTPPAAPKKRRPAVRKRKPAAKKTAEAAAIAPDTAMAVPAADAAPAVAELIRVPLTVRWRDLDAFNHVNNSKYLSYLEEARLRWMMTLPGMGLEDSVAPVVAASNLNYRRPIGWPGEVVVELFVERIGNTSITVGHRIVDADDSAALYCDGNVVMVWIDRENGRAAPLPEAVRDACG
jgi:acyl-CoA thioester hydrolase